MFPIRGITTKEIIYNRITLLMTKLVTKKESGDLITIVTIADIMTGITTGIVIRTGIWDFMEDQWDMVGA